MALSTKWGGGKRKSISAFKKGKQVVMGPTPRMREYLQLYADGCTREHVQKALKVTQNTVYWTHRRILQILGADAITQAVRSVGVLFFALAFSVTLRAQEVKYIDLSLVPQRTELRHPPAPQPDCDKAHCVGGGYGVVSVGDGAPDRRDPHALGVYLRRVTPTDIDPSQPFEVEFRVLNTGLAPIDLPVSPHLSDLQPSDESMAFGYFSLALVVQVEGPQRATPSVGLVELYGSAGHEGSILVLKPGEWITVRANVKLRSWPSELIDTYLRGEFWLRRNTFYPHPGGGSTQMDNLYPNATSTPGIPVHLLHPAASEDRKQ